MADYKVAVERDGRQVCVEGKSGVSLLDTLISHDVYISAACGGIGKCGKCRVRMTEHPTEATKADREFLSAEQITDGWRLACLSYPQEDCRVVIESGNEDDFEVVSEYSDLHPESGSVREESYDIGIDIGTTTIAVNLIGATSGEVLNTYTSINHQRAYGADVISRMQASNEGKGEELKHSIRKDLYEGIHEVVTGEGIDAGLVKRIAIAGNTTMGHLLMGFSCETLGVYPFTPVNISTIRTTFSELFDGIPEADGSFLDAEVTLLPGVSTYVGADITAGMLAEAFDRQEKTCLLIDLGTNGEMAIGNREKIMVTSTAAGPAFEGGNISCGMGSVKGAICGVRIEDGTAVCETIGEKPPVGLCGTGVIETVYELLRNELLDETGMLDEDYFDDGFVLAKTPEGEEISFTQKDVREIQLAKSAVRAGMETLLLRFGATYEDVDKVFLAGGFGYKIDLEKAIGIGLLPEELHDRILAVGNSSLSGTVAYLTDETAAERIERIAAMSEEIPLSTDKDFNRFYTDYMFFE